MVMAVGPFGENIKEIQTFGYPLIKVFFGILALGQAQDIQLLSGGLSRLLGTHGVKLGREW